jgi:hypothetical protein
LDIVGLKSYEYHLWKNTLRRVMIETLHFAIWQSNKACASMCRILVRNHHENHQKTAYNHHQITKKHHKNHHFCLGFHPILRFLRLDATRLGANGRQRDKRCQAHSNTPAEKMQKRVPLCCLEWFRMLFFVGFSMK